MTTSQTLVLITQTKEVKEMVEFSISRKELSDKDFSSAIAEEVNDENCNDFDAISEILILIMKSKANEG